MKVNVAGHFLTGYFLALPPVISVITHLLGIPIPSYFAISLIGIIIILCLLGNIKTLTVPKIGPVTIFLTFYLFLAVFNTISKQYYSSTYEKLLNVLYVLYIPILLITTTFLLKPKKQQCLKKDANLAYFKVFKFSNILFFTLFLFFAYQEDHRYLMPGIDNSIWISRHLGAGILVYIFYLMTATNRYRFLHYLLLFFMFIVLLKSGSRTPLAALVITATLMFLMSNANVKLKWFFLSIIILSISIIAVHLIRLGFWGTYYEFGLWSLYYRFEQLIFVIQSPISFFGNGFASFGPIYLGKDEVYYPHNLFFEMYFEFGVVGFFFICVLIFQLRSSVINCVPGFLFIYFLVNSMFSGDIIGNVSLLIALVGALNIDVTENFKSRNLSRESIL